MASTIRPNERPLKFALKAANRLIKTKFGPLLKLETAEENDYVSKHCVIGRPAGLASESIFTFERKVKLWFARQIIGLKQEHVFVSSEN